LWDEQQIDFAENCFHENAVARKDQGERIVHATRLAIYRSGMFLETLQQRLILIYEIRDPVAM
jgi:hypothetical protein